MKEFAILKGFPTSRRSVHQSPIRKSMITAMRKMEVGTYFEVETGPDRKERAKITAIANNVKKKEFPKHEFSVRSTITSINIYRTK